MKAIILTNYGSPEVLQIEEVAKPIPQKNEILIRVFATTVNFGDTFARRFNEISPKSFNMPLLFWFFAKLALGFKKPKISILGSEFAGEISAVGEDVKSFKAGDHVFGYLGMKMGAYAEYICMPESGCVTIKPSTLSFEEAATLPYGTIMAFNLLKSVKIEPGQKVLINGASGGIGSAAVQFAKYYGAEVTGVCSTPGLEYVKCLGADKVIDYTKEDFTKNGESYDVIFDILGKCSFTRCKASLKPNGKVLYASFKMVKLFQMFWTKLFMNKKVICKLSAESKKDLNYVKELIDAGKIKAIIGKSFTFENAADAHRYTEGGNKKGSVVITFNHNN
jgi:NADPH:quinone reductase-like Zn-dependent oxidoreductase